MFFTRIGHGRLDAARRLGGTRAPKSKDDDTSFFPRQPLADFAEECLIPRFAPDLANGRGATDADATDRLSDSQPAAAAAFWLVSASVWYWSGAGTCGRVDLERLLWIAPLAAAVTSVVFLAIAVATKRSQFRRLSPPSRGSSWSRDSASATLPAWPPCTIRTPVASCMGAEKRRDLLSRHDGDERSPSPHRVDRRRGLALGRPGIARRSAHRSVRLRVPLDKTVDCRARFGPDGLEGSGGRAARCGRWKTRSLRCPISQRHGRDDAELMGRSPRGRLTCSRAGSSLRSHC